MQTIDYPELVLKDGPGVNPLNVGRKCEHGVILKVVSTNICCSDQHMVPDKDQAMEKILELTVLSDIPVPRRGTGPLHIFADSGDQCPLPCASSRP